MIRKAFLMTLKSGSRSEYERRHNPIWPELQTVLKEHGVSNYSIFYDDITERLFAYAEIESEERWRQVADNDVCKRWWAYMADLMMTHADKSPVTTELEGVFHLE
jgi:L-rhamnose mutarotase